MIRAWPLTPILLILVSLGLVLMGGLFIALPQPPIEALKPLPDSPELAIASRSPTSIDIIYPPNTSGLAAKQSLLSASPFHPDRSAYERAQRRAPLPPPEKVYTPVVMGVLGRGERKRVMITWEPGTDPQTHALGDETPWGKLTELGSSNLTFLKGDKRRELDLFGR